MSNLPRQWEKAEAFKVQHEGVPHKGVHFHTMSQFLGYFHTYS